LSDFDRARQVLSEGWFDVDTSPRPLGEGHINDTLLVTGGNGRRFVLQRINRQVFVDPGLVMANLERVRTTLAGRTTGAATDIIPELIPTRNKKNALVDELGDWWRLWRFVEHGRSLSTTRDPSIALAAGSAFGRFQLLLEDLADPPLVPTIAGFLELPGYLNRLDAALTGEQAHTGRLSGRLLEAEDRAFIDGHRHLAAQFPRQGRYIHGDCKLNNLLFAADRPEVVCVLDLDTIMLGHWAWDFGDLSRSLLVGGAQEAPMFKAVVEGFVAGGSCTPTVEELVLAPRYVAFMLGVRFLTDHLEGDRYFKVRHRGENLQRAREQFDLIRRLQSKQDDLASAAEAGLSRTGSRH